MYTPQQFDGLPALLWGSMLAAFDRTGIVTGCEFSLTTNTDAITGTVSTGTVQVDGTGAGVSAQTVTFEPNPHQNPRRDVVWLNATGVAQVRRGDPEPYQPSRDPDSDYVNEYPARRTFRPAPDDMSDVLGVNATGALVATVLIPPGADASTDLSNDEATRDWTDRRLIVPSTAGAGSHNDLTDVASDNHHARYTDGEARTAVDQSNVSILGNAGSVDGYDIYVQNTVPTTDRPYIRFEDE